MTSLPIARELVDAALALLAPRLVLVVGSWRAHLAAVARGYACRRWDVNEPGVATIAECARPGDRFVVLAAPDELEQARAVASELVQELGRRVELLALEESVADYLRRVSSEVLA